MMSNTARKAHYVIPDYMVLETPGTTHYTEYTKYYGLWTHANEFPYAMYSPALVPPPENADLLDPGRFFHRLGRKMGLNMVAYANPAGVGQHWEKPPAAIPLPTDRDIDADELLDILTTGSRVPLSELRRHPHGKLFDELNDPVLPRQADCDARLALDDSSMMNELDLVFANRGDAPDPTDEFPLLLITRRSNDFYNSTGRHNPRLGGAASPQSRLPAPRRSQTVRRQQWRHHQGEIATWRYPGHRRPGYTATTGHPVHEPLLRDQSRRGGGPGQSGRLHLRADGRQRRVRPPVRSAPHERSAGVYHPRRSRNKGSMT